ncbi:hypothetical protein NDU88_005796, partial [Pleurodeles waltl]
IPPRVQRFHPECRDSTPSAEILPRVQRFHLSAEIPPRVQRFHPECRDST